MAYCRRATRRAGSNFAAAFRLLPGPQRQGMHALYAFFRATDDISDDPGDPAAKREKLARWRAGLAAALGGVYSHRLHAALHHTVRTFGIDPRHLTAVLDGVEADLEPVRFATFAELYPYCYRVASAVGLACIPVWGTARPGYEGPAEAVGVAFQLTNVLRDLDRFGSPPEAWRDLGPAFREMMRFQVSRAREYYAKGEALDAYLTPAGRAINRVMGRTYRGLLDEIERRDFDVFTRRVRVGKLTKVRLLLSAWPAKWGWV
jgi:phytoene synthase